MLIKEDFMENLYLNYGLVMLSVVIFGFNFACTDKLRSYCGSGLGAAIFTTSVGSLFSSFVLFTLNGFRFEFSPIAAAVAVSAAVSGILFTFCSYKALDVINLSLYSLFSMLGGMTLPFVVGIIFFDESLTVAKAVCFAVIVLALAIVTTGGKTKKNGYVFYAGVFVLNGLSGVLTTVYKRLDGTNVSSTGYTLLVAVSSACMSAVFLPFFINEIKRISKPFKAVGITVLNGLANRFANLILAVALAVLPASAQYPMVTGGVIIVSTIIAAFTKKKPTKREIISVILSFAGILALVLIPF